MLALPGVNLEERTLEYSILDPMNVIRAVNEAILGGSASGDSGFFSLFGRLGDFLASLWNIYSVIAILLSIIFFLGYIYARIRFGQYAAMQDQALKDAEAAWAAQAGASGTGNTAWATIQSHMREDSPNDWKAAIIEADIMLDKTLTDAGYVGTTVADKLKSANASSFQTLEDAWAAHKIRNQVAHAGGDFILTRRLAQETIVRYERIFKEFGVI